MPSGREWFRLYNRMTQDPKIQHLSDYEFRLIIHIWCLASESNERGRVYVAPGVGYMPDILARGAGCRDGDPVAALETMRKLQLIDIDDHGVIEISNWDKLQYEFDSWTPEARRKQKAKERCRKKQVTQPAQGVSDGLSDSVANVSQSCRRTDTDTDTDTDINNKNNMCFFESQKSGAQILETENPEINAGGAQHETGNGNVSVPPAEKPMMGGAQHAGKDGNVILPAEIPQGGGAQQDAGKEVNDALPAEKPAQGKGEYTPDFEQFWSIYPRKEEKRGAFKVWNARQKEGATSDSLITAAQNYADFVSANGTENKFIKLARTFLGTSKPYEDYIKPREGMIRDGPTGGQAGIPGGGSVANRTDGGQSTKNKFDGVDYSKFYYKPEAQV